MEISERVTVDREWRKEDTASTKQEGTSGMYVSAVSHDLPRSDSASMHPSQLEKILDLQEVAFVRVSITSTTAPRLRETAGLL